jgi:hypothetical protein
MIYICVVYFTKLKKLNIALQPRDFFVFSSNRLKIYISSLSDNPLKIFVLSPALNVYWLYYSDSM